MATLEAESTLTKRGQTTVPSAIRRVLRVTNAEDRLVYRVQSDGSVVISKKEAVPGDPVIAAFLAFIAKDACDNLAGLRPVTAGWLTGLQALVKGVEVDLEAPLSPDDE